MKHPTASAHPRARRGSTFVYLTMMLTVSVGFAAFSFDLARFRTAKGELEAIADAAALNAANGLIDNTYVAKANAVAAENQVEGVAASLSAADVVPGYWSGTAFTANGAPRNAVRVTISRTKAAGNSLTSYLGATLGWASPDLVARSTVALIEQGPYEWTATDTLNLSASSSAFKATAFDATNPYAAETTTTIGSYGTVNVAGPATLNANVQYGSSVNVSPTASVAGSISRISTPPNYPPGSQVANLNGVTPVYSATYDMTVNTSMTIAGGVYVMKNFTVANCNITFTGPVTIVATGNCTFSNVGLTTYGNLPANLRVIATTPGSTININNPTMPMYADFYAPDAYFNFNSAAGYAGLRGRGVFKTLNAAGDGASLYYDRSLNTSSMSKKAVVVD